MSADGGDRVRVTSDLEDEHSPAWSPDGRAIAFVRSFPFDIWLVYLE
jgi:Tol biopolymer transport system component